MYQAQHQRFRESVVNIHNSLIAMALEPRLMPGVAADVRGARSSASTPSLRSLTPVGAMEPGGNVRVVVRVRGFLPRGGCYL